MALLRPVSSASRSQRPRKYDAFISYSHAQDAPLARRLQENLQRFAKPWYRLNSARIFRDETNLAASPGAWPDIKAALSCSGYLILLASTKAVQSKWVRKELAFWLSDGKHEKLDELTPEQCPPEKARRLFIVLTDGVLFWDDDAADFDWTRSSALPHLPAGTFAQEPLWVDLAWATMLPEERLGRDNRAFMQAVAKVLAPIKDLDIQILVGKDYAVHRRNLLTAYLAVGTLAVLAAALLAATLISLHLQGLAEERARIADSRRLAIEAGVAAVNRQVEDALELALASYDTEPTVAARDALLTALQVQPRLERIISMPGRTVSALAYSFDDEALVGGDLRGDIHKIDVAGNSLSPEKTAEHAAAIHRIAQTDDGCTIAVADHPDIGVWSADGQRTKLRGHRSSVRALAWEPDARALASGDLDGRIQVRASLAPSARVTLQQPHSEVFSLLFVAGVRGELLSSGRGRIYRWQTDDPDAPPQSMHSQSDDAQIWEIQAGPDGSVAACDERGIAHIWGPEFSSHRTVEAFSQGCVNLRWLDEKRIVAASSSGELSLLRNTREGSGSVDEADEDAWNAWRVVDTWQGHPGPASAMAVTRDGARIASGGPGGIRLWNFSTEQNLAKSIYRSAGHAPDIVTAGPGGRALLAFSGEHVFQGAPAGLWITASTSEALELEQGTRRILAALIRDTLPVLVTLQADNRIVVQRFDHSGHRGEVRHLVDVATPPDSVAISTRGRHLVFSLAAEITVVDLDKPAVAGTIQLPTELHGLKRNALAVTDSGDKVIAWKDAVYVWHAPDDRSRFLLQGRLPDTWPLMLAPSDSAGLIAMSQSRGRIRLYDAETLRETKLLTVPDDAFFALAFSHDGTTLAAGGMNERIQLWDVSELQRLGPPMKGHEGGNIQAIVRALSFSPDGSALLSAADDGVVLQWDADPDRWRHKALSIMNRPAGQEQGARQ